METFWNWHIAMGEFIGTFILTLTIIFSVLVTKREAFGLNGKWKQKGFQAAAISSSVVVGIVTGKLFGGLGFINPAIAIMGSVLSGHYVGLINIISFEILGGLFAALILLLTVFLNNLNAKGTDVIDLSKVFTYNKQSILKSQRAELLCNVTWLLPIAALLIGVFDNDGVFGGNAFTSVFQLSMVAAFGLIIVILAFGEFGAANLNPAVWIGEFLIRICAQKKLSPCILGREVLTAVNALLVGAACGGLALLAVMK